MKSFEITTPAVDEVVEVGTKKVKHYNWIEVVEKKLSNMVALQCKTSLPDGTRNVKVQGVDGEKEYNLYCYESW